MNSTTCCHPILNTPFFGTFAPSSSSHQAHFALLVGELFLVIVWVLIDLFNQSTLMMSFWGAPVVWVLPPMYSTHFGITDHRPQYCSTVVLGVSLRLRWTSSTTTHVLQYSSTPVHSSTVILLHCTVLCYLQYSWQWTAVFGVAWGYGRPVVLLLISPLLHYDTAGLYSTAVMALYTSTSTAADVPVQLKTKIRHCSCPVMAPSSRCTSTVRWQQYAAASLYCLQAGWYYCSFFCIQSHIVPPLFCFFF